MHFHGNGWTGIRSIVKIIPVIGTKFPRFRFSCQFPGEVNMNVTVDSEETTCKLAKGTAAATDPADLPDRIPAGGILEVCPRMAHTFTRLSTVQHHTRVESITSSSRSD